MSPVPQAGHGIPMNRTWKTVIAGWQLRSFFVPKYERSKLMNEFEMKFPLVEDGDEFDFAAIFGSPEAAAPTAAPPAEEPPQTMPVSAAPVEKDKTSVSVFDKPPVFSYGGVKENIADPSMTKHPDRPRQWGGRSFCRRFGSRRPPARCARRFRCRCRSDPPSCRIHGGRADGSCCCPQRR